jgi:hypothetical protein
MDSGLMHKEPNWTTSGAGQDKTIRMQLGLFEALPARISFLCSGFRNGDRSVRPGRHPPDGRSTCDRTTTFRASHV